MNKYNILLNQIKKEDQFRLVEAGQLHEWEIALGWCIYALHDGVDTKELIEELEGISHEIMSVKL